MNKEENKKILQKLVRHISDDNGIIVREGVPSTDGENVYIPLDEEHYLTCGYSAHEGGHIGYGTFEIPTKAILKYFELTDSIPQEKTKEMLNILEDVRVDTINGKIFPAFRRIIDEEHEKIFEENYGKKNGHKHFGLDLIRYLSDQINVFPKDKYEFINNKDIETIKTVKNTYTPKSTPADTIKNLYNIKNILKKLSENSLEHSSHYTKFPNKENKTKLNKLLRKYMQGLIQKKETKDIKTQIQKLQDKRIEKILKSEVIPKQSDRFMQTIETDITSLPYTHGFNELYTYDEIVKMYQKEIETLRKFFNEIREVRQNLYKTGRLNKTFMRAYTSDYYKCFDKKIKPTRKKISLLVDVSGSMNNGKESKMDYAKRACVVFSEALKDIANIRVSLFGGGKTAMIKNVKKMEKDIDKTKYDLIGSINGYGGTPDGISILNEAMQVKDKNCVLVAITDGEPSYNVNDSADDIESAKMHIGNVFCFAIEHNSTNLNTLYGKDNWIETKRENLTDRLLKLGRLLVQHL